MRKRFISVALTCFGCFAFIQPIFAKKGNKENRKNIILIMTDQQTADAMSYVGNKNLKTPGMDTLAEDGALFPRSYVSYPLSGPARASLVTGRTPVEMNVYDNHVPVESFAPYLKESIGNVMKKAGYETLYAGKWHAATHYVNLPPTGSGFTKVSDMDDPILVDKCIPYLEAKRDKPLFLVASFLNPHEICEYARYQFLPYGQIPEPNIEDCPQLPYNAGIPAYFPEAITLNREFDPRSYPIETYDDNDWRRYLNAYYRLVERVDEQILRLINELKKNNLYDDSLIIFVSDHGDGVGAHRGNQKRVLQEEIVKVPFIVKTPNEDMKGEIVQNDIMVNTSLDIFQTILDYAGIGPDESLQGKSLKPFLEGDATEVHDEVYVETLLNGIETRGWAVIGKDYKYVVYRSFKDNEQLFNLKKDPYEMQNLIVDKQYDEMANEFREKLYQWGIRNNDKTLQTLLKNAPRGNNNK